MKVFVVGATGYIGGTVAVALRDAGHSVIGLARTGERAAGLRSLGIEAVLGGFDDRTALEDAAKSSDATINVSDSDHIGVVRTLIGALAGSGKMLVHTSGSSIIVDDAKGAYASDTIVEDDAPFVAMPHRLPRIAVDHAVRRAGITDGIRTAVICPTMVYGLGRGLGRDSDQIPKIAAKSRELNAGAYIGEGANIWSNVFVEDLATLFGLVLEHAPSASFFYAENGELSLKEVAAAVSHSLGFGGKTVSWDLDAAKAELGMWPQVALATNCRVRATNARRLLGWRPAGPALSRAQLVS
ncbi:NAD-dependent epimerase/dehydratase family protein [Sphingomonas sp. PAMC 26605]|uniref:NAD-dependent epimerase/dehydratase family protein n=1 Tax=Sphingomonas sp. PAMC 26605 TaxID=1112214 RepID=UPI00026CB1AB|nr:NAD-dependent epimerase/dehydratase family protein [Sphingomonas sp. PAMC 26605]